MNKLFVFLTVLFLSSCHTTSDTITVAEIIEFDKKYGSNLILLCDSVQAHLNLKTSYLFEFRPKSQDVYFSRIDSLGNGGGYFEPGFLINQHHRKLLDETIIHHIVFNRKNKYAFMKTFLLKTGDKAVCIEVLPSNSIKMPSNSTSIIIQNGRCIYGVSDAW
ncbi:hypothetical protein PDL71_09915 [Lacibacter sp. MH-610]|uniref:hypothetical protein n=1 Tax=Lacibacter sp. MH-610 TaxID=3020883 RepID=UPI0038926A04